MVQVGEGEVGTQAGLGGLAADLDSGEVEQDVDRHGYHDVRAGGGGRAYLLPGVGLHSRAPSRSFRAKLILK
jgi:hypothetical protein